MLATHYIHPVLAERHQAHTTSSLVHVQLSTNCLHGVVMCDSTQELQPCQPSSVLLTDELGHSLSKFYPLSLLLSLARSRHQPIIFGSPVILLLPEAEDQAVDVWIRAVNYPSEAPVPPFDVVRSSRQSFDRTFMLVPQLWRENSAIAVIASPDVSGIEIGG